MKQTFLMLDGGSNININAPIKDLYAVRISDLNKIF